MAYPTRIWCCVEVFAFLSIGAAPERMSLYPLIPPGTLPADARQAALERIVRFDIRDATAFLPSDRDTVLEKVESGFDALERYNQVCAQALVRRLKQ